MPSNKYTSKQVAFVWASVSILHAWPALWKFKLPVSMAAVVLCVTLTGPLSAQILVKPHDGYL